MQIHYQMFVNCLRYLPTDTLRFHPSLDHVTLFQFTASQFELFSLPTAMQKLRFYNSIGTIIGTMFGTICGTIPPLPFGIVPIEKDRFYPPVPFAYFIFFALQNSAFAHRETVHRTAQRQFC